MSERARAWLCLTGIVISAAGAALYDLRIGAVVLGIGIVVGSLVR